MARLATGLWVSAYLQRLGLENIPAYVLRRGDPTAGAVLVKLSLLDGTARAYQRSLDPMTGARHWMLLAEGPEAEVDATLERQRGFDPDLWIVEVESRDGRSLLDEPGLSD
jgi:hypothetical protein